MPLFWLNAPDVSTLHRNLDVGGLIKALSYKIGSKKYEHMTVRSEALKALLKIANTHSIPYLTTKLINALNSRHEYVRSCVVQVLCKIRDKQAAEPLIRMYKKTRTSERYEVITALGNIGDPQALEILCPALQDEDWRVRSLSADALGLINNPRSVDPLILALKDKDMRVRNCAAMALGKIGDKRASQALRSALHKDDNSYMLNNGGLEALGKLGDDQDVGYFLELLFDRYIYQAAQALRILGWSPTDDEAGAYYYIGNRDWRACAKLGSSAVGPLCKFLKSSAGPVQKEAIATLGKIGDPRAVEALTPFLVKNDDKELLLIVIEALGKIGGPQSVEALILFSAITNDNNLLQNVIESLGKIGDQRSVDKLISIMQKRGISIHAKVITALGMIGGQQAIDQLIIELQNDNYIISHSAGDALAKIGGDKAINALKDAFMDEKKDKHEYFSNCLDASGWKPVKDECSAEYLILCKKWDQVSDVGIPAIKPILKAIGRSDPHWKNKPAITAIGNIKDPNVVDILVENIKTQTDDSIRNSYLDMLSNIHIDGALEKLITLVRDKEESIRIRLHAMDALQSYKESKVEETFLALLNEKDDSILRTAIRVLGAMRSTKAVDHFISLLDNREICGFAAEALGIIQDQKALMPLKKALNSGSDNRAVIIALINWGDLLGDESVDSLIEALEYTVGDRKYSESLDIRVKAARILVDMYQSKRVNIDNQRKIFSVREKIIEPKEKHEYEMVPNYSVIKEYWTGIGVDFPIHRD